MKEKKLRRKAIKKETKIREGNKEVTMVRSQNERE